jgi:hypothetical protein
MVRNRALLWGDAENAMDYLGAKDHRARGLVGSGHSHGRRPPFGEQLVIKPDKQNAGTLRSRSRPRSEKSMSFALKGLNQRTTVKFRSLPQMRR